MKNIDFLALVMKVVGWISVITLPIRPALIAISVLTMADFFSGIWASIKENKPITSNGLSRTVKKILSYQLVIVTSFVIETYLLQEMPVVKVVSGFIAITEGKSFFENIRRITGIDFWTYMISKLNLEDVKNQSSDEK